MKVLIVGGGVAGYTAALACQKFGLDYEIFEAKTELSPQGAGIWLSPNGLQVLKYISPELVNELQKNGETVNHFGLTFKSGQPISLMDMKEVEKVYGFKSLMIHRHKLQSILTKHLTKEVRFDKQLRKVKEGKGDVSVEFEDSTKYSGSVVLGCDGVGSIVRESIFPPVKERESGQYCWRSIVDFVPKKNYKNKFYEQIGDAGLRVAYAPVNDKQVYVYVTAIVKNVEREKIKEQLFDLVGDFPFDVDLLIKASKNGDWVIKPLNDFEPIKEWYKGRVALVGDAAHAMTPNMGQGGNQAIESAFLISKCLSEELNFSGAFKKYQTKRKPKVDQIIDKSWKLGQLISMKPLFLRDLIFKVISKTPKKIMLKQLKAVYQPDYLF